MRTAILLAFVCAVALTAGSAFAYSVPNQSDLLFSLNTDSFPESGATGAWARTDAAGGTFATMGTPTVDMINGVKWAKNLYAQTTGYNGGTQATAIPINGATIVAAIKPVRSTDSGNWRSIVDILYDRFCLIIANNTGQLGMRRNQVMTWGPAEAVIPDGQTSVVSVVMAPDGTYTMYVNGTLVWTVTTTSAMTELSRSGLNTWGVGRNTWDGWSTYNGNIGDVYVYKVALGATQRGQLEDALKAKFRAGAAYPALTITASAGAGGSISPSGAITVPYEADRTFTITKPFGYTRDVVVDGVSMGDISSYTFNDVTTNHTIQANFTLLPTFTVSGNVVAAPGGGATVAFKQTPSGLPAVTATTDASGNYSAVIPVGTYYACASQTGYMISADQTVEVNGNVSGVNFSLSAARNIPKMEQLLFVADTNSINVELNTNTGNWPVLYPTAPYSELAAINTPTLEKIRGIKYVRNQRGTGGDDGYRWNSSMITSPIPTNGATVVAVVRPIRNSTSDGWNSVVDIFRDNLILGVKNNTGQIHVRRNGIDFWSTNNTAGTLASGQLAILSLVVQPDGTFSVWCSKWNDTTNTFDAATVILSSTAVSAFTAFVPSQMGPEDWRKWINIGRNNGDGWTSFNGYIGDVFVYKTALTNAERATLEAAINLKQVTVATYNITATAGPNGSISPAGVTAVGETDSLSYTITPNFGYMVADVVVDGVSQGSITSYTFVNVAAAHTISATFAPKPTFAVTGKVTNGTTGIAGATVFVSTTANAAILPTYTTTTDASGNYSFNLFDGTWYVCATATGYASSADIVAEVAGGALVNPDIVLAPSGRNIPQKDKLLVAALASDLVANGATTDPWAAFHPKGLSCAVMGTPAIEMIEGVQWEQNRYNRGDGYRVGTFTTPIPVNGVTATAVIKPMRESTGSDWTSIIDVFYNRLVLGIRNNTGELVTMRNGSRLNSGVIIPDGQKTVLTMVVQPTGEYKVYANGYEVINVTTTSSMTALVPGAVTGNLTDGFDRHINIGRNQPDGWTTFTGNIGDVIIYKTALGPVDRIQLESDLGSAYSITMPTYHTITATAGVGGTITPAGNVPVMHNGSQTFTIAAQVGYILQDVTVNGVSQGAITSYTFENVTAPGSISATFRAAVNYTISGKVFNKKTGVGVPGATVYFATTPNASLNPVYTVTADANGNYTRTMPEGTWYVAASATNYYISADGVVVLNANKPNTNIALSSSVRNIPRTADLLFSAVTDTFPASGNTGPWATYLPAGDTLATMGTPAVEIVNGAKWVRNVYADGDGYFYGNYSEPIAVNGATIVVPVIPIRDAVQTGWSSVVDVMYDRLVLAVQNSSGLVIVRRNGQMQTSSTALPDGQMTMLSLVVQPDGSYKVFANSKEIMSAGAIEGGMTSFNPLRDGATGFWSNINVGRNQPDGWTTFNGNIGDVFVYKAALTGAELQQLEWDIYDKFGFGGEVVTISGKAFDSYTSAGVPGVTVTVLQSGSAVSVPVTTDANGNYSIQARLEPGSYSVVGQKLNYLESPVNLNVVAGLTSYTNVDLDMFPLPPVTISGTVYDATTSSPAANVKLYVEVQPLNLRYPCESDANGNFSVEVIADAPSYVVDLEANQTPNVVLLTPLSERSAEYLYEPWSLVLNVAYPSTITGKVVTSDATAPSGFVVTATDGTGAVVSATTAAAGTYSLSVLPGRTYSVAAKKPGYVTMPAPQSVNVVAGSTTYPVADFTAYPSTISGVLKNAATGQPIYNGVVQSGTLGAAVVTDATGVFSLPATGCGGVELFGDALGYRCANLLVTGYGNLNKTILLTAQVETGVLANGGFEDVVGGQPVNWSEHWTAGGLIYSSSTDAFSGSYSAFISGTASYSAMAQYLPVVSDSLYTFYFKAKADAEVTEWFPMCSFRGPSTTDPETYPDVEYVGWVSGEPGLAGWAHNPPKQWTQYLRVQRGNGTGNRPFVRLAPPTGATNIAASFCFAGILPAEGKGCYIDDVVIDRVSANEPVVVVDPDPSGVPVANLTALKAKANGTAVILTGPVSVIYAPKNGTARTTNFFYIGEAQGLGGIKVVYTAGDNLTLGQTVSNLTGTWFEPAGAEPYLQLSAAPSGGAMAPIAPVGMNNKSVLSDAKAKTNAVKVWGQVMSVNGTTSFTISDGFDTAVTVNINGVALPSGFGTTKTVTVTGVLSADGKVQAQSIAVQ